MINKSVLSAIVLGVLLILAAPGWAEDRTPLTTAHGCHRFTLVEGGSQALGSGVSAGTVILRREHDGRQFTVDFETWNPSGPLTPLTPEAGDSNPLVFVNWRFRENGAKGTDRGRQEVAPSDPATPNLFPFYFLAETIQGNRYKSGGTFVQGIADASTGVSEYTVANILWCTELK